MSDYIGRFAPSPTGPLHVGSVIAALASFLDARHHRGRWRVRMEDVDETRCDPAWADAILRQLDALQLTWDGAVMVQSQRKAAYEDALAQLRAAGHVFGCDCSRREIADSALPGLDRPVYPGTCRQSGKSGPGLAWRLKAGKLDDPPINFDDAIQGRQSQWLARDVGDFVLKRRDGLFAYQLAVVVDDHDQRITHVMRGADLLDSTPRQIHLQRLLGFAPCEYSHLPVAVNEAGQKLSKQTLAPAIDAADGVALLNRCLAFLGQPIWPAASAAELLALAIPAWDRAAIPKAASQPADRLTRPSA
ncbi:MAG: tRNA glutamyl-Q(34) synthetase GluQRS [Betaproteobacteria bacterium]|nr:tRNA glutamyl-Q(34) synthetase GluQRS [Betaproteobacteria bacterium]